MRYTLAVKTGPESEPVTLAEAKDHLLITDTVHDAYVTGLIQAAREQAENFTSRALLPQTFSMYLDCFPGYETSGLQPGFYPAGSPLSSINPFLGILLSRGGEILIPRAPVSAVDSIKYIDTTGTLITLDPNLYQVDPQTDCDPVRILPAYGKTWPSTRYQPNAVTIQFEAGYADAAHIPGLIKLAIKQILADWNENREAVVVDARVAVQELPNAAKQLLWDYRLF